MSDLPLYYTSLREFRGVFATGTPILTYHKLGPRPARVRLKGLYVGARLFEQQLTEWAQSGWRSTTLDAASADPDGRAQSLVLTFDDGFENVLRYGVEPMARHGFQAIQFLVADLIGAQNVWEQQLLGEAPERLMDAHQVRDWLAAGHEIGAHTRTHPHLTRLPPAEAREEIGGCRKKLEDLFGRPIRHFCYPYGDWNAAVRDWVIEAGYTTACTVDTGINTRGADRFALKRFTVRYRSRNWKTPMAVLREWVTKCSG